MSAAADLRAAMEEWREEGRAEVRAEVDALLDRLSASVPARASHKAWIYVDDLRAALSERTS